MGAVLVGSEFAAKYGLNYSHQYRKFEKIQNKYLAASEPKSAFGLGNLVDKQLKKAKKDARLRDTFMYSILGLYVLNIVDAFLKPKIGYRKSLETDPYVDFAPHYKNQIGVSAHYNF